MGESKYTVSEAVQLIGVSDHVLRYWQSQLDLSIGRNNMGHRCYTNTDIDKFRMVKKLMAKGIQLKAIKLMLPEFECYEDFDDQMIIKMEEEQEGRMNDMHQENMNQGDLQETQLVTSSGETEITENESSDRMEQFKAILGTIVLDALKENNTALSSDISQNVTESVIKEMSFLLRLQEEKEEERFKKFDATLRDYQKARSMTAAAYDSKPRKKSKFLQKNRVYI